ncbi:MAG: Mor transcription activator family protein [Pseudomonadota bacterium]
MSLGRLINSALIDGAGLSSADAERLAKHIIEWGGRNGVSGHVYYWPNSYSPLSAEERAAAIAREFDGTNLAEVCEKYGVGRTTVYRDLHQRRKQSSA